MSQSLYNIDKRIIFRETFQSADSVRKNGGTITNTIFNNGIGEFSNGGIFYNKIIPLVFSIRIVFYYENAYAGCLMNYNDGNQPSRIFFNIGQVTPNVLFVCIGPTYPIFNITLTPNTWNELIITSSVAAYLNGVLVTTGTNNRTKPLNYISVGSGYSGKMKLFEIYNKVLTASEVKLLYNQNLYSNLPAVITDNTPNCFEGNNAAYIEVPDNDLLSFGDGAGNDQPFWQSFWIKKNTTTDVRIINKYSTNNYEYSTYIYATGNITIGYFNLSGVGSIGRGNNTTTDLNTIKNTYHNVIITYDGSKTVNGIRIYVNKIEPVQYVAGGSGVYNGMSNSITPLTICYSSLLQSNEGIFDFRIGSGTLTTQQVQDIYQGKRVGTERLWLPLCENAGNTRFDVSGNNLHGTLKGTQDGKYNVGKQNKFDYYSLFGGSSKANTMFRYVQPAGSPVNIWIPSINVKAFAIRFFGCTINPNSSYYIIYGNSVFTVRFASSGNLYLIVRYNSVDNTFNGTNNTIAIPSTSTLDGKYHSLCIYLDGTNLHCVLDGVYKGYVTFAYTQVPISDGIGYGSSNDYSVDGLYYDFRAWKDAYLSGDEALKYHNNTMTVTPQHQYSLIGSNPVKDLIGSNDGIINRATPLHIPLLPTGSTSILPYMSEITTLPVVQRSFREVFRLNANKGIVDQYGNKLLFTGNGGFVVKKHGKVNGMFFHSDASNFTDIDTTLNSKLNDGFIIKIWLNPIYQNNPSGVRIVSNHNPTNGFSLRSDVQNKYFRVYYNFVSVTFNSSSNSLLLNTNTLILYSQYKEMYSFQVFNKNGLVSSQNGINQYYINNNYNIGIGSQGNTQPFYGTIFDLSISTAGILSLEEATAIYNSEKNNYF